MTSNTDEFEYAEVAIGEIDRLLNDGYQVEVDSPDGWVGVNFFVDKGMWDEYILTTANGKKVRCNENHLFKDVCGLWRSAADLLNVDKAGLIVPLIMTDTGPQQCTINKTSAQIPIVDINVDHENHRYYTNGIESHNTGVGKTLVMCHMAGYNLRCQKNVLYITNEMAEERIAQRIDANLLDCPINDIQHMPKLEFEKKIARVRTQTKGRLIIKEFPTASAGAAHYKILLDELRLKKNFVPDVIYIDYLNLCVSSRIKYGASTNSYTYIKAIAEELRGLAVQYDVPIITATQTNRAGIVSSDIGLENTSDSIGLPMTVDFMIGLVATEELQELNQIVVKQLKNRYGDPTKYTKFVVGVDRAKMRLYNVEQSAQEDLLDGPLMDATDFGIEEKQRSKPVRKFDRNKFRGFN